MTEFYDLEASPSSSDEPFPDEAGLPGQPGEAVPGLFYGSVDEFVRKHLRYHYRRTVGKPGRADYRWRADWWRNEEASARLDAMWDAWEAARTQPAGAMSQWWIEHCDRHMQVLMSTTGPFATSQDTNTPGAPLPHQRAPKGMFAPDRQPKERPDRAEAEQPNED